MKLSSATSTQPAHCQTNNGDSNLENLLSQLFGLSLMIGLEHLNPDKTYFSTYGKLLTLFHIMTKSVHGWTTTFYHLTQLNVRPCCCQESGISVSLHMRRPRREWSPWVLCTDPPNTQPNRWRAAVASYPGSFPLTSARERAWVRGYSSCARCTCVVLGSFPARVPGRGESGLVSKSSKHKRCLTTDLSWSCHQPLQRNLPTVKQTMGIPIWKIYCHSSSGCHSWLV